MKRKRKFWGLAILGALAMLLGDLGWRGEAFARGGGGGRGGGGFGGGGRGRRGGFRGGGRGGSSRGDTGRREEQERLRRELRQRRVDEARIKYAKRERQKLWLEEFSSGLRSRLGDVLDGNTE
ncbi:MAG: hypothetical protein ACE5JG_08910 [Planctomycetota bacterium]